ncbi:SufE family protein, partial [Escherichia coli]|nr:SufE family protein [Escherichia coli]
LVWLVSQAQNGVWHFCADSDARIVRGLIALVMAAYDGKTADQIQAFDIDEISGFHSTAYLFRMQKMSRSTSLHYF